jgi:hydrogenase nickel incorporation protein HypA/HybF
VHEFGIASEIWQAVQRAAKQHGGKPRACPTDERVQVRAITVEIGELNLIEDEQLRFWVTALAERDGSAGVELRIAHLPLRVRCRGCGEESAVELAGEVASWFVPPALSCPRCGSREVEVIGGREIRVVSAEVEAAAER